MKSPERRAPGAAELADSGQNKRRNGVTHWLLTRGLGLTAAGALGVAGYMALVGGTVAAAVTAPLFVAIAGGVAAVGASALALGMGKAVVNGFSRA